MTFDSYLRKEVVITQINIDNEWYLLRKFHSCKSGFQWGLVSYWIGIWKWWFLRWMETGESGEKFLRA